MKKVETGEQLDPAVKRSRDERDSEDNKTQNQDEKKKIRKVSGAGLKINGSWKTTIEEALEELDLEALGEKELKYLKKEEVPFLRVDVPLDGRGWPDLLLLDLPETKSTTQRIQELENTLKNVPVVLACGVCGAGKTATAFSLAKRQYSFYFDWNGNSGKVKQCDVAWFLVKVRELVLRFNPDHFGRLTQSILLSRWLLLRNYLSTSPNPTPFGWLLHQLQPSRFFVETFIWCQDLSDEVVESLLEKLMAGDDPRKPLVIFDEAHKLQRYEKQFSKYSHRKHTLGSWMLRMCRGLSCYASGNRLSLRHMRPWTPILGAVYPTTVSYYKFDFLGSKLLDVHSSNPCSTLTPIDEYFSHVGPYI